MYLAYCSLGLKKKQAVHSTGLSNLRFYSVCVMSCLPYTNTLYLFLLFLGSWLNLSIFRSFKKKSQPSFSYLKISKLQDVVAQALNSSTWGQRRVNLSEFKVSQACVVSSRTM